MDYCGKAVLMGNLGGVESGRWGVFERIASGIRKQIWYAIFGEEYSNEK